MKQCFEDPVHQIAKKRKKLVTPSQGYGFSSSHVWMWELDCEEGWALKNWCFWTVVLEKTLESPLDCKEIQPVHFEGDQPWDFFGSNDAKAEAPVLWPSHAKSWLIGKDSDAGRDWGQEEKGTTKDEMAGWHHGLNGSESEWTPGDGDGQGGLACCDHGVTKELDTTERLNWAELNWPCLRSVCTKTHHYFIPVGYILVRKFDFLRLLVSDIISCGVINTAMK